MFKNDIEVLPAKIPKTYDSKHVLAEQIRLVLRHMPLALVGAVFTSLCFFFTMFASYDLNDNQRTLNIIWLIYHTLLIGLLWRALKQIFKTPKKINHRFLRGIFTTFGITFFIAMVFGITVFISMLYRVPLMKLSAAKILIVFWIVFHIVMIYVCWINWKKIKALLLAQNNIANDYLTESSDDNLARSFVDQVERSTSDTQNNHISHYASYSVLSIITLAIGCLWALAIGKAFVTNIQNFTQVIVLLGLHMGLLSGGISSLGTFWRTYILYVAPSIFIWIFLLLYLEDVGLTILSIAVISLYFFSIFFARHSWQNTLKAILIYLENNNLVAQLQIKTRQVEEASLARTQFLAAASHDLRQPVHALSLFIEALSDTNLNHHQKQIVDYAKSASQSSRSMLNTILDFAHLESGHMTPHFVPTNLDSIIQNLIDEFGIQAEDKGLSLRYRPTNIWVMTDPTMVALILRNFISNAIRYTNRGGILIGVRDIQLENQPILIEYCRLSVWDTGSGMTSTETKQIFDSFYQIERNKTTDQGLGLGLAIVKGMTQLLKADLSVRSNIGIGSQFSVVLPICPATNGNALNDITSVDHLKDKKVLIVDDDNAVLKSMQLLLQSWGCESIAVQTLDDAVSSFCAYKPDIVITDFRLANGITGEDVIIAIRQISDSANEIAFVILTADTSPQLFTFTKVINPLVLHKPIDPKNLRQQLQQIAIKKTQ